MGRAVGNAFEGMAVQYLQAQGALQTDGGSTVKATSQSVPPGTETAVGTVATVVFADMVNTAND